MGGGSNRAEPGLAMWHVLLSVGKFRWNDVLSLEEENVVTVSVEDGVGLYCGVGQVAAALWFQETQ